MKNLLSIFFLFYSLISFSQTWEEINPFIGRARINPISVLLGDVAYIGFGQGKRTGINELIALNDLYRFNPLTQTYAKTAEFPRETWERRWRYHFSFSLNGKIYIGGEGNSAVGKELLSYDPNTDSWAEEAKPPMEIGRSAFTIGNNAYVGLNGTDKFYKFDGQAWTEAARFQDGNKERFSAFVINGKAYIAGGVQPQTNSSNENYSPSIHEYDPLTDNWTVKIGIDSLLEFVSSPSFVCDGKAHIISSFRFTDPNSTIGSLKYGNRHIIYDPVTNRLDTLEPIIFDKSVVAGFGVGINNVGYVGLGTTYPAVPNTYAFNYYHDKVYKYNCSTSMISEIKITQSIFLYPSISYGIFNIDNDSFERLIIHNLNGQKVKEIKTLGSETINLSDFPNGIYIAKGINENNYTTQKIIISK